MGYCKLKGATVFGIGTEELYCSLSFGTNTKFEYWIEGSRVKVIREHICINMSKDDFEKHFEIMKEV